MATLAPERASEDGLNVHHSRGGGGGIGRGDLALQLGVQQILIALDLDVADQVGVVHQDGAVQIVVGAVAQRVAAALDEVGVLGADVILEYVLVLGIGGLAAAEYHVAVGGVALGVDTGQQLAGTAGDDLDLNAVALLEQGNHRIDLRIRGSRVDHELLFLCRRAVIAGSGLVLLGAAGCQRQSCRQCQKQGQYSLDTFHVFMLLFCFLRGYDFIIEPLKNAKSKNHAQIRNYSTHHSRRFA